MSRLCERPGCSAPAAVAYGMDSEHLLVWLEIVPEGVTPMRVGMLCRRHADAMVVPRGWTLDDRREAKPRLFRVAEVTTNHPSRGRKPRTRRVGPAEPPLQFDFDAAGPAAEAQPGGAAPDDGLEPEVTVGDIVASDRDPDETQAMPWRPVFDHDDDLDGLLKADSPLLSRAFRGRSAKPPR